MATKTVTETIKTFNDKTIIFYPNSHRYKYEGEKTYLVSPSSVTGVLDKSNQLLIWNDRLVTEFVAGLTKVEEGAEPKSFLGWEVQKMIEDALGQRKIKVEEAQEIGDVVHNYAERTAWAKTVGDPLPELPDLPEDTDENRAKHEQIMTGIQAFIRFEQENAIEYLDAERFVYSESHGVPYVGRFDAIIKVNGLRVLTDYKTSKGVYSSQKYQTAGYDLAMIEEYAYRGLDLPYDAIGILHFDKNTGIPMLHVLTEQERKRAQQAFLGLLIVKDVEKELNVWGK